MVILLLYDVGVAAGPTPRCMEVDMLIGLLVEAVFSEGLGVGDVRIGEPHKVQDGL